MSMSLLRANVRLLISSSDDGTPRCFELATDATPEDLQQAISAGAEWFGVAFAETLRRARQRRAAEPERAEVERAA